MTVEALLLAQVLEADVAIVAGKSFRRAQCILHSGHVCEEVGEGLALQLLDRLDARGGVHPQPYATTRCDRRTDGSSPQPHATTRWDRSKLASNQMVWQYLKKN